jgi:hypothetical protein
MIWTIYGLVDPDSRAVRYVGYTRQPLAERLKYHLWDAKRKRACHGKTRKAVWIRSLVRRRRALEAVILQSGVGEWMAAEQLWIATFRAAGMDLLNMTIGGRGVRKSVKLPS